MTQFELQPCGAHPCPTPDRGLSRSENHLGEFFQSRFRRGIFLQLESPTPVIHSRIMTTSDKFRALNGYWEELLPLGYEDAVNKTQ